MTGNTPPGHRVPLEGLVRRLRQHALPDPHDEREVLHAPLLSEAADAIEALQAKVDALMLEFCPGEMTPEQIANWGAHQAPNAVMSRRPQD